jgi:hypothetical protein
VSPDGTVNVEKIGKDDLIKNSHENKIKTKE